MKRNQKDKSIFESIRKPLAKPSILMDSRRRELLMESIEKDDLEEMKFAVDIPNMDDEVWDNIGYFNTRKEALEFVQDKFGADDEGRIKLITEI